MEEPLLLEAPPRVEALLREEWKAPLREEVPLWEVEALLREEQGALPLQVAALSARLSWEEAAAPRLAAPRLAASHSCCSAESCCLARART